MDFIFNPQLPPLSTPPPEKKPKKAPRMRSGVCEYNCKDPICIGNLMGLHAHVKLQLLGEKKDNEILMCWLPRSKKYGDERFYLGVNSSSAECSLWSYFLYKDCNKIQQ